MPCWALPCDHDAIVLRLHELGGCRGEAELVTAVGWQACLCDVRGNPIDSVHSGRLRFGFRGSEIVSILINKSDRGKKKTNQQ